MKALLKIALLLSLPAFAEAQYSQNRLISYYMDSLHMALRNASNDTIRMDIYGDLAWSYQQLNRDSSVFYADRALQLARQLDQKLEESDALNIRGVSLLDLGDYPQSLESLMQALHIAEDPANEKNYRYRSTARTYRLTSLGFTHMFLGDLYFETGNSNKAISNYSETIKLAGSVHDAILEGDGCMQLGVQFMTLNKFDSALFLEQRALGLFSNLNTYWKGHVYHTIGEIYFRKGNIDLSREAFLKAAQISEEQDNGFSLGPNYISLSHLYQSAKNVDSSLLFAHKALQAFKRLKDHLGIATADSLLSSIYSDQKNTDSSYAYLRLATALKDSLHSIKINKLNEFQNIGFEEQMQLKELEEEKIQTQTKIRTYAMLAGIAVFMLIAFLLYRNNRNRKKANELLQKQKEKIEEQKQHVEQTLIELKSTQAQLIQSEKMASLGELTAGIAHEIQNPLNFVNNFSEVNKELVDELQQELKAGKLDDAMTISNDIRENEEKISHHGKRAEAIVKGMLQHSRSSTRQKEPSDINALADEYLRLAYHGLRSKDKSFNATLKTDFDNSMGNIPVIPQDIGRVLLNLYNNAFYAALMPSRQVRTSSQGGFTSPQDRHEPTVWVTTKKEAGNVFISVKDNGPGIPEKILDKIFQPFFTTKPTGQGTGLGLSLSYDIIKAHGGELKVKTREGEGAEFIIKLPIV